MAERRFSIMSWKEPGIKCMAGKDDMGNSCSVLTPEVVFWAHFRPAAKMAAKLLSRCGMIQKSLREGLGASAGIGGPGKMFAGLQIAAQSSRFLKVPGNTGTTRDSKPALIVIPFLNLLSKQCV